MLVDDEKQEDDRVAGGGISGDNNCGKTSDPWLTPITDKEISDSVKHLEVAPKKAAFRTNATRQMPQENPPNATTLDTQMPQTIEASNATNATTETIENAQPTGWGKLWRIEKNGKYYIYRLRFHADRPTQPGGRITPEIEAKCHKREGKGRHKKSREEAERFRGAAEHIAERIRAMA